MIEYAIPQNGSDVFLMVMHGERNIEYVETWLNGGFFPQFRK